MTVFTAVSIALSTSGSTFAALNQLSNLFDERIKGYKDEANSSHTFISENVLDEKAESRIVASKQAKAVDRWLWVWKYCSFLPMAALLFFSTWVGVKVALRITAAQGEDLATDEHWFYSVWIWIILGINGFALTSKGWAWTRMAWNKSKLKECKAHIRDSKPDGMGPTNVGPVPEKP